MTPQALLRQRRAQAARALAADPRRAQLGWDDLAAWPDWAALAPDARRALAQRAGAWLHAGAIRRSIDGAQLKAVRRLLGDAAFTRLMAGSEPAQGPLPDGELEAWLADQGHEALLASVASPLLRLLLRERVAPRTLPPIPALDTARARKAVAEASR